MSLTNKLFLKENLVINNPNNTNDTGRKLERDTQNESVEEIVWNPPESKYFKGKIKGNNFTIQKVSPVYNRGPASPVIEGQINENSVYITIKPSRRTKYAISILYIFAIFTLLASLKKWPDIDSTFLWGFFVAFIYIIYYFNEFNMKKSQDIEHLKKTLNNTIE